MECSQRFICRQAKHSGRCDGDCALWYGFRQYIQQNMCGIFKTTGLSLNPAYSNICYDWLGSAFSAFSFYFRCDVCVELVMLCESGGAAVTHVTCNHWLHKQRGKKGKRNRPLHNLNALHFVFWTQCAPAHSGEFRQSVWILRNISVYIGSMHVRHKDGAIGLNAIIFHTDMMGKGIIVKAVRFIPMQFPRSE